MDGGVSGRGGGGVGKPALSANFISPKNRGQLVIPSPTPAGKESEAMVEVILIVIAIPLWGICYCLEKMVDILKDKPFSGVVINWNDTDPPEASDE